MRTGSLGGPTHSTLHGSVQWIAYVQFTEKMEPQSDLPEVTQLVYRVGHQNSYLPRTSQWALFGARVFAGVTCHNGVEWALKSNDWYLPETQTQRGDGHVTVKAQPE